MPDMRRFLDFTGLGIYDAKIKQVISTGDANALAEAKKYFDDNKSLFEAAGAVKTAQELLQAAIDAVDAKVNGILNGESIDSFADVETELAKYQLAGDYATKEEAQGYANAKDSAIAAAQKAGDDAQADLNTFKDIVSSTYETQVNAAAKLTEAKGYTDTEVAKVDVKVTEVNEKVVENAGDIAELAGKVATLEANGYDDTEVRGLIKDNADAIDAVEADVEVIKGDYLKAADKTELQDAIDVVAGVANAAATKAALEEEVGRAQGEEARIEGLVTAEVERATKAEKDNADAIKAISDDYLKAADKIELQDNIDVVAGKVTTLVGEDANKSVRTIANEELAKQLIADNAAESLDTLAEIAAWIQSHPEDAAAMNKAIDDLEALVGTLPQGVTATNVVDYIAEVKAAIQVEIDRLDAEKQDVITEKISISTDTVISDEEFTEDYSGYCVLNNYNMAKSYSDAPLVSDLVYPIELEVQFYQDIDEYGNPIPADFTVTINSVSDIYQINDGYYLLDEGFAVVTNTITDDTGNEVTPGIYHTVEPSGDTPGSYYISNFAYKSQSTSETKEVVKKEHLPADVVYEADLNSAINSVNTANAELSAEIAKKADKTTVEGIDGRVGTLESEMATVDTRIENAITGANLGQYAKQTDLEGAVERIAALESADGEQDELLAGLRTDVDAKASQADLDIAEEKIANLEAKFGDGEGSVSDLIADAVAVETSARESAVAGVQAEVDALEGVVAGKADSSVVSGIDTRLQTAEGEIDTLQSEMDAVEAVAAAAAKASDLTALAGRVTTNEGAITTLNSEMDAVEGRLDDAEEAIEGKAAQADLDALTTRVTTAETNIATNTSALAKFTEITEAEINALFAQ